LKLRAQGHGFRVQGANWGRRLTVIFYLNRSPAVRDVDRVVSRHRASPVELKLPADERGAAGGPEGACGHAGRSPQLDAKKKPSSAGFPIRTPPGAAIQARCPTLFFVCVTLEPGLE
jgi:hypothetical protein